MSLPGWLAWRVREAKVILLAAALAMFALGCVVGAVADRLLGP